MLDKKIMLEEMKEICEKANHMYFFKRKGQIKAVKVNGKEEKEVDMKLSDDFVMYVTNNVIAFAEFREDDFYLGEGEHRVTIKQFVIYTFNGYSKTYYYEGNKEVIARTLTDWLDNSVYIDEKGDMSC